MFVVILQVQIANVHLKGFLIQARTCADDTPVGRFIRPSVGNVYQQLCSGDVSVIYNIMQTMVQHYESIYIITFSCISGGFFGPTVITDGDRKIISSFI